MALARDTSGSWRLIAGRSLVALGIGVAAVALHREPPALAAPAACPGLPEALSTAVTSLARTVPLGTWWLIVNAGLLAIATAFVAGIARAATRTWRVACVTALTFGVSSTFAPVFAPFAGLSVVIAGATVLTLTRIASDGLSRMPAATWSLLALAALVSPRLSIPVLLTTAWLGVIAYRSGARRWRSLVIGAIVLVAGAIAIALLPALPPRIGEGGGSCLWPFSASSFDVLTDTVFEPAGAYAIALAVLGAFSLRGIWRHPLAAPLAICSLGSVVVSGGDPATALRTIAPAVVGFWVLVAIGLDALIREIRPGLPGRVGAMTLLVLLPGLEIVRPIPALAVERAPLGHEAMSLDTIGRMLGALPNGAVLVSEDAMTDALLRAARGTWQRSGKALHVIGEESPELGAVSRAPATPVFALPSASSELRHVGFRLSDAPRPQVSGVALVSFGGTCQTLGPEWHALTTSSTIALAARDARSTGPVVAYFSGGEPFRARPIDWPGFTTRGFVTSHYEADTEGDGPRRARDVTQDKMPDQELWLAAPYVLRLELWRTTDAPLRLAIDVGQITTGAVAKLADGVIGQQLALCPSFPYERKRIGAP